MGTPLHALPPRIRGLISKAAPMCILDEERSQHAVTIPGTVMGKPRMTQRDRWAKRPCVLRYRAWADSARSCIPVDLSSRLQQCYRLDWIAYLPIPPSWSKRKQAELAGRPHRQKPDRDNIDKGVMDALFPEDSGIHTGTISKRWDDGKGPRLELTIFL